VKQRSMLAGKLVCPGFWWTFCHAFLGIEKRLAVDLWQQLYPSESQPLLYQIARLEESGRRPDCTRRFGALANPALLLRACERLSPSGSGTPRRRDVVLCEEAILSRCDSQGQWV
jgi:hypothetical protein